MNEYTVKEPKIVLFIGLPYTVFFLGLYALSMIYAVWYCADFGVTLLFTLLFGGVSFPGIYLIVSYFRRRLIINGTRISYTPAFGSTRIFSSGDIQVITLDAMTSVKLRSLEGKRLACFELNMTGSCAALSYLESQNITVVPSSSLASRLSKTGKRNNSKAESRLKEEQDYILSRWDEHRIMAEKRTVQILHVLMAVLLIISLFMPQAPKLFCLVFIPLFCYGMYLFFYPKITLNTSLGKTYASCRIPFPTLVCCFDAVFLLILLNRLNMEYWAFAFGFGLLLAVCYFLVLLIRKRRERVGKLLSVLIAVFLLAVITSPALNAAATFQPGEHASATVLDKKSHHSRHHGNDYHLMVKTQDEVQIYNVSKDLYISVELNDSVIVCKRQSIFGVKWVVLHQ